MKEQAKEYAKEMIRLYPSYADGILGFYDLFLLEIEDECASIEHEYELMVEGIKQLLNIN